MNIPGDELYTLLHAALKKRGQETLQRALYLALREAILGGRLRSGSQLPGSRTLAQQISVSRNTVNAALDQLTLEGYLLRNRQGTRVGQFAHRTIARTLPDPDVSLTKRVALLPAPVPIASLKKGDAVVAFSRREVLMLRDQIAAAGHPVSVIYGALPPEVRRREAERFAQGATHILVATDAIGMADHGAIVWDEVIGFGVTMIAAPAGWEWVVAGFALFRLFDVLKPWPISWFDRRIHGGLGIMLDDLIAGLFALLCMQLLARW